ncbi:MAG: hypothetical protein MUP03_07055 [Anaerolineales bacterium]|nr:hypothetical protein [Anaerolineales bacterium]
MRLLSFSTPSSGAFRRRFANAKGRLAVTCPPEKVEPIRAALRNFGMIR